MQGWSVGWEVWRGRLAACYGRTGCRAVVYGTGSTVYEVMSVSAWRAVYEVVKGMRTGQHVCGMAGICKLARSQLGHDWYVSVN